MEEPQLNFNSSWVWHKKDFENPNHRNFKLASRSEIWPFIDQKLKQYAQQ